MSHNTFSKKIFEYKSLILEKFSGSVENIHYKNYNELHILTSSPEAGTEVIYFINDNLKCRLVTMICTDERFVENRPDRIGEFDNSKHAIDILDKRHNGFILRHVFSNETEDIFFVVTSKISNKDKPTYPSIVRRIPSAVYYEREICDMFGVFAQGNPDT